MAIKNLMCVSAFQTERGKCSLVIKQKGKLITVYQLQHLALIFVDFRSPTILNTRICKYKDQNV